MNSNKQLGTIVIWFACLHAAFNGQSAIAQELNVDKTDQEFERQRQQLVTKDFLFEYCTNLYRDDSSVSKQLAMVPSQVEMFRSLLQQHSQKSIEHMQTYENKINEIRTNADLPIEKRMQEIRKIEREKVKQLNAVADSTLASIQEVLLPHQFQLLKQLGLQYRLRQELPAMGLAGMKPILLELGLTAEEKRAIEDAIKETQSEFEAERAKLRQLYEQKAKKALPVSARAKLQTLVGDFYYFSFDR